MRSHKTNTVDESKPAGADVGVSDAASDDLSRLDSPISSEHDSDDEYFIENVLTEHGEGAHKLYLVQWTGYPENKWTWEPADGLPSDCILDWEKTKAKELRGEVKPFDVAQWEKKCQSIDEQQFLQHRRRNKERKRRGMELSIYPDESDYDSTSDGDDANDHDLDGVLPPPRPVDHDSTEITSSSPSLVQKNSQEIMRTKPSQPQVRPGASKSLWGRPSLRKDHRGKVAEAGGSRSEPGHQTLGRKGLAPTILKKTTAIAPVQHASRATSSSQPRPGAAAAVKTAPKAKKSGVSGAIKGPSTGGVNVFLKGTRPRQKQENTQSGSSRTPQLYINRSTIRKAELRGRDRADKAPLNPSDVGLFPITTGVGPAIRPLSLSDEAMPTSSATPQISSVNKLGTEIKSSLKKTVNEETTGAAPSQPQEGAARGKTRSVHFDDETAATIADKAANPPGTLPSILKPTTPLAHTKERAGILRTKDLGAQRMTRVVNKVVCLGPADSPSTDVDFEGLPAESPAWISNFMSTPRFTFAHKCTARDFVNQQKLALKGTTLAWGNLTSPRHTDALDAVSSQLRMGSFGLVCFQPGFYIVIYPGRCDDWKMSVPQAEASTPAGVAMKYMILKPHSLAAIEVLNIASSDETTSPNLGEGESCEITRRLLGFDYNRLLSTAMTSSRSHSFFLVFPPSRASLLNLLVKWVSRENPACRIFSSLVAGDWKAFLDPRIVDSGCVMVYEAVTSDIMYFSNISKLLHDRDNLYFTFWMLGEALEQYPLYPSTSLESVKSVGIDFVRLFPHGKVVLLTPSFFVTRPRTALQLLQWVELAVGGRKAFVRIVVSANIEAFLRDLESEKSSERAKMLQRFARDSTDAEARAQHCGLGSEDIASWPMIFDKMIGLMGLQGDEEAVILADDCIDANDEQSLANWFGWWSLSHLDQFRKFYILGSHDDDSDRAHHEVQVPKFAVGAATDPDQTHDNASSEATPGLQTDATQSADQLGRHLREAAMTCKFKFFPVLVYLFPVSYFQATYDMADYFGDSKLSFKTYKTWFDFIRPFGVNSTKANTYIGLFYTIKGEWDSRSLSGGRPLPRHPWLAIFRVQNSFLSWQSTELIIWDANAPKAFPAASHIHEDKMMPAQRALIDCVRENNPQKNGRLPLRRIWYGGYDGPGSSDDSMVQKTLAMLDAFVNDPNEWIPPAENKMALAGFKKVRQTGSDAGPDPMDVDSNSEDGTAGGNDMIVFHPPRGNGTNRPGTSACGNLFFAECQALGHHGSSNRPNTFVFKYPPTQEWYLRQKAEGRHYEHIKVADWTSLAEITRQGKEKEKEEEAASPSSNPAASSSGGLP